MTKDISIPIPPTAAIIAVAFGLISGELRAASSPLSVSAVARRRVRKIRKTGREGRREGGPSSYIRVLDRRPTYVGLLHHHQPGRSVVPVRTCCDKTMQIGRARRPGGSLRDPPVRRVQTASLRRRVSPARPRVCDPASLTPDSRPQTTKIGGKFFPTTKMSKRVSTSFPPSFL